MENGYETVYYLSEENGKRKFAVLKMLPQIDSQGLVKTVKSGKFQFVITDETSYEEIMRQISEKLQEIEDEKLRDYLFAFLDNVISGILIDGLTFELDVEKALYLAKLIQKFVEEDYEQLREIRQSWMLKEHYRSDEGNMFF